MKQSPERCSRLDSKDWPVLVPLVAILLVSLLIRQFDIDRKVSELCYDAVNHYWPFERAEPWLSFYRYGIYPPVILGIAGAIIAVFGRWILPATDARSLRILRRGGLFLILTLMLGPGLIVEAGLKELWGRPRPLLCEDFGGEKVFCPVGEMATHRFPNSSFPSGHAAVAFFLMAPAFVIGSQRPNLRRAWLVGGIGYGLAMGFTRVLQGGHFLSDVLWAGFIVYFVGVGLARLLKLHGAEDDPELDPVSLNVHDSISVASTS